ncbi:MAG: TRAP transporter substrate-binding protein DctP [Spirochaetia bacterium]|nr:TRAP transporter substrate-binding protein DctP [Spirochaetia bacterium]
MKKIQVIAVVIFAIIFIAPGTNHAAEFTLKYAAMAPQGSLWHKYSELIKNEIEKRSGGRIAIKAYYGGIAGDEKTMAKKLKAGLIDMAAFSGMGLGEILPSVRLLELPMFFDNYSEVDRVIYELNDYYSSQFEKQGVILGAWGEGGFVYLMSIARMNQFLDMKGLKIWAPSGDLIVKSMFQKYGFVPVFLGFESVLPQLQTGGLSAVYAPPMAAIGLQWYGEVHYIYDVKLSCSTGATLFNKAKFSKLPIELQEIILNVTKKYSRELILSLRQENKKALEIFEKNGIELIKFPAADLVKMQKYAIEVQDELAGSLYEKEILETARKLKNATGTK